MSRIVLDTDTERRFRQDWLNPRVLVKQMVARFGHTNDTLRRIAADLGLPDRADDVWTDDLLSEVSRRYGAGESPTVLAREKGLTRSAIVAKLSRENVIRRREDAEPSTPKAKRQPVARAPQAAPPAPLARTVIPFPRLGGCQWPEGDPLEPGFHLCGVQKARGSYCAEHAKIAFKPAQPQQPRPYDARGG